MKTKKRYTAPTTRAMQLELPQLTVMSISGENSGPAGIRRHTTIVDDEDDGTNPNF